MILKNQNATKNSFRQRFGKDNRTDVNSLRNLKNTGKDILDLRKSKEKMIAQKNGTENNEV